MRHRVVTLLAFFVILLVGNAGRAAPTDAPLALTYQAPPQCPNREAVMAEVVRLARLESTSERRIEADIRVEVGAEGFTLKLSTRFEGAPGERSLEGQTCASVVNAATLILALMLNPDAVRESDASAVEPGPASEPSRPPPSQPLPARVVPAATPPAEAAWPLAGGLAALAGARMGALPDPAPELGVGGRLALGPFVLVFDLGYLPSQHHRVSSLDPAGGRLWVVSAGGALGYWAPFGDFRLGPSAGLEVTRLQGRGAKVTVSRTGTIYWTSLRLGLDAGLWLSTKVVLDARLQGLGPLHRPRVFVEDLGVVHRPDRLGGRAGLSIGYVWQ